MHLACLNVIKGEFTQSIPQVITYTPPGSPMQIDVCSVSQGDKRVFSTLSQALGLMADLDLGTLYPLVLPQHPLSRP